jgi:hypothetical protein
MLNATYKPFMLSVIVPNVIMLSVMALYSPHGAIVFNEACFKGTLIYCLRKHFSRINENSY